MLAHVGYLLPWVGGDLARVMGVIALHLRHVFNLPRAAPRVLLDAECGLLPFSTVRLKQVLRLYETLRLLRHGETATVILRAQLEAGSPTGSYARAAAALLASANLHAGRGAAGPAEP